jgi:hypothetical protein
MKNMPVYKGVSKYVWKYRKMRLTLLARKLNKQALGDQVIFVLQKMQ